MDNGDSWTCSRLSEVVRNLLSKMMVAVILSEGVRSWVYVFSWMETN